MEPMAIQALFYVQASALRRAMQALLGDKSKGLLHDAMDYIDKASCLADWLGIDDAPCRCLDPTTY